MWAARSWPPAAPRCYSAVTAAVLGDSMAHGGTIAVGVLTVMIGGVRADSAAQNHRSMHEKARLLIEREVRLRQPGAVERARSWRECMRERPMPQLLEDLRSDRDR
jgi:hypothetical protein